MEPTKRSCGNELVKIITEKQFKTTLPLIIQFCQSINEVFSNGSLTDPESTDGAETDQSILRCVQKFRQVHRNQYRGMTYLSSAALKSTQKKASEEAKKILQNTKENDKKAEVEKKLESQLILERFWIEKSNEFRRQTVWSQMKQDACMEFHIIEKRHFPALSIIDSQEFYEENIMNTKLEEMRQDFILNLRKEIPFVEAEDPAMIAQVCDEMVAVLNQNVINILVEKNQKRKQTVEDLMTNILKESVDKFTNKLMEATDGKFVFGDPDEILELTSKLRDQFRPVFTEFGHKKCRERFMEIYKTSTFEVLKGVLNSQNSICQNKVENTSTRSNAKIQTCFAQISEVFQENGIPLETMNLVQKMAQEKMNESLSSLQKSNQQNLEFIFSNANNDDYLIEKRGEKIYQIMTDLKSEYVEQLNAKMKVFPQKDKLEEKDHLNLRQFHKEKKAEMCKLLEMDFRRKFEANEESFEKHQTVFINFADAVFHSITGLELMTPSNDPTEKSVTPCTPIRNDIIIRKTNSEPSASTHINSVPTLTFQLTPWSIRMAAMIDGKPEIIENEFGERCTDALVGFTKENKFIYGNAVCDQIELHDSKSADCILRKSWDVYSIDATRTPWRQQLSVNGKKDETITYEFLWGFLFKKLKNAAEKKIGKVITTTVITVPYWFNSVERIQIKDAAALAGFNNVTLVNDGAAAAWYCFNAIAPNNGDKIMAFSHNGTEFLNVFLYEVVLSDKKELKMLAHKVVQPNGKEGDQNYLENGATEICSAYKEIMEDRVMAGETVFVQMAWDLNDFGWTTMLKKAMERIIGMQVAFMNWNEAMVKGGAMIGHTLNKVGIPVIDKLDFNLFHSSGSSFRGVEDQVTFSDSGTYQPKLGDEETVSATVYMRNYFPKTSFFQDTVSGEKFIGKLNVSSKLKHWSACDEIVANFYVNHEQIVVFEEAVVMKRGRPVIKVNNSDKSDERVVWQSPNLPIQELDEQKNLLNSVSSI